MKFLPIAAGLLQRVIGLPRELTRVSSAMTTRSLADVARPSIAKPIVVVDHTLVSDLQYMPNIYQVALGMFSGIYLQAISMATTVEGVSVSKVLNRVNPEMDPSLSYIFESMRYDHSTKLATYKYRLPITINMKPQPARGVSTENLIDRAQDRYSNVRGYETEHDQNLDEARSHKASMHQDMLTKVLMVDSNMAVGKYFTVTLLIGDEKPQEVDVVVNVTLDINYVQDSLCVDMLSTRRKDTSFSERWWQARIGEISFINEFLLCNDLIDERKKMLLGDRNGVLEKIRQRASNNKIWGVLGNNPSLATASNIAIISSATARQVETKVGGKLSNASTRDKVFTDTNLMMLMVVDYQREVLSIYTRNMESYQNVSFNSIKNASSGKGMDVGEVFKALNTGNMPTIKF